ncbi:Crp/Fnr family transcriptional regulator [Chryseobacterium taiwanense]|uniref:Cyclic nucleotide-binding domain-containing protein n=1 Tax=Chryseobacterium taiwanense TaxID=363331 RepID=A0A0B4E7T9_9FLAO|nr:Crp/Fnr family transcriptional regulator [Chryseobacterium taiwanense]KIC62693.1 hypothetical protein RM51_10875 [Chryseobacterium taiwanense]
MIFNEELLLSLGAEMQTYKANEVIFTEGGQPNYFYQIKHGSVKLNNYHEDGREFIHSVPFKGHCFGETFLFSEVPYPINAIALEDSDILKLPKLKCLEFLKKCPKSLWDLYTYTAERMYYRYIMLNNLSVSNPLLRVRQLMDCLKNYHQYSEPFSYQIPFTRQQLASLTGLRIETVIRVVKKMEKEKMVKIELGKIFY